MNEKRLVQIAMLAGEIMLASGAETYRVEDTITHILKISGFETAEAIVTGMALSVTLADDHDVMICSAKRIIERQTDLGKVYKVNNISRQLCGGQLTLDEAYCQLKEIRRTRTCGRVQKFYGTVGTVMFFSVLLGGSIYDFAFSTINGLLVAVGLFALDLIQLNTFFTNIICAFVVAITSTFVQQVLKAPISLDVVISGSILPLVPGVAITNAIRDTLQGDYMSGAARTVEAFVLATSIAIGIGLGLSVLS